MDHWPAARRQTGRSQASIRPRHRLVMKGRHPVARSRFGSTGRTVAGVGAADRMLAISR